MHGMIFQSLKHYVIAETNQETWNEICKMAKSDGFYLSLQVYPDTDLLGLCQAASKKLYMEIPVFLEHFGRYLMKDLIKSYHLWIKPEWKVLDFLLNVECVMHSVARTMISSQKPAPPQLEFTRVDVNKVTLKYTSPRKLCWLAKGLVQGAADHYRTTINIKEEKCMHQGDFCCFFVLTEV